MVLSFFYFLSLALDMPEINEKESKIYNGAKICWSQPNDSGLADSYVLEYRKLDKNEDPMWNEVETTSTNKVLSDLDPNSSYCFRVQGLKGSVCSPHSKEVVLKTPPAPGELFLNFTI